MVLSTTFNCDPIDPQERSLSAWQKIPDAVVFATEIHPMLAANCATTSCHARDGSFRLNPNVEQISISSLIEHPIELPILLRDDYYRVLAFCDPQIIVDSLLLVWGANTNGLHPGGSKLTAEEQEDIIDWLSTPGGSQ
jgi:hypothetical protein